MLPRLAHRCTSCPLDYVCVTHLPLSPNKIRGNPHCDIASLTPQQLRCGCQNLHIFEHREYHECHHDLRDFLLCESGCTTWKIISPSRQKCPWACTSDRRATFKMWSPAMIGGITPIIRGLTPTMEPESLIESTRGVYEI